MRMGQRCEGLCLRTSEHMTDILFLLCRYCDTEGYMWADPVSSCSESQSHLHPQVGAQHVAFICTIIGLKCNVVIAYTDIVAV